MAKGTAVKKKVRSATGALSPERIVRAAADFIERRGVDAMTLRAIAEDLGCAHTALFWHFRTRDDLLRGVLSQVMAEMASAIPQEGPWDERAKTICHGLRRRLLDQPSIFELGRRYQSRGIGPFARALVLIAREAGYKGDEAVAAGRMLLELVGGYSMAQDGAREIAAGRFPSDLIEGAQSVEDIEFIIGYSKVDQDSVFEAALEGVVEVLRNKKPILRRSK